MREIADVGASELNDFAVGLDKRIGSARQRLDLDRETALKPFSRAGTNGGERVRNPLERRKAEPDLKHRGEKQYDEKRTEGDHQRAVKIARLFFDFRGIARNT